MKKIKFEHTPMCVINTHSMVDLITNSSTELFVCDTKKTIEMVKEILKSNPEMHGYEEPWIFDVYEYRKWREKERERQKNWKPENKMSDEEYYNPYRNIKGWFYDEEDEEDLTYLRKNFIENGYCQYNNNFDDYNPYEDRIRKELLKYKDNDRYKGTREIVEKIYDEIFEAEVKPEWWATPLKYHRYNDGTPVHKLHNCIILMGDGDNSIPYDEFEWIERTFNAKSYHLG